MKTTNMKVVGDVARIRISNFPNAVQEFLPDLSSWVYGVCCNLKVVVVWGYTEWGSVWPDSHGITVSAEYGVTLTRHFKKLENYSCFILCLLLTETVRACVCMCARAPVLFTCSVSTCVPWTRTPDYKNRKRMVSSNLKCKHLDFKGACVCS
jgi:hypothetical protein